MKIYFKWLNEWKDLNNDLDNICGAKPEVFVQKHLSNEEDTSPMDIIQITKENTEYYVRAKDIVWKIEHTNNEYINEERW